MSEQPLTSEEIVFLMARFMKGLDEDPDDVDAEKALRRLMGEAVAQKILIDDDSWYVFDGDGNDLNPRVDDDDPSVGFSTKGYCWLYWVGYGMPDEGAMLYICDPEMATAASGVAPESIDILTSDKVIHDARMHVDNAEIARTARAAIDGE